MALDFSVTTVNISPASSKGIPRRPVVNRGGPCVMHSRNNEYRVYRYTFLVEGSTEDLKLHMAA